MGGAVRPNGTGMWTLAVAASLLAGCFGDPAPGPGPSAPAGPVEWMLTPEGRSASEVTVAVDPTDALHAVAAANSEGGFGVYWTFDGGTSWEAGHLAAQDVASVMGNARFAGLSDPALAFGPDGTLYLAGLAYIPTSSVFVAVSRDGGRTWPAVHLAHESDLASSFNDKEWVAASPATGTLVLTWQKEPAMDSLREVDLLTGADVDVGDIVVARSADGGETWTAPAVVSRGLHNNGTQVAFTADGRGHLAWVNYEDRTLDYAWSGDDGATWSQPRAIADVQIVPAFARYARMHTLPGMAAAGRSLAIAWHDNRNGDADVYVVASDDGGATWSPPTRVHDDEPGNGVVQFYPWVAIGPAGDLHVAFYDGSADPQRPLFDYVVATRGAGASAFGQPVALSAESFPAFDPAPPSGEPGDAHTLGDYTGLAAGAAGVVAAWADGRHAETVVYGSWWSPGAT